MLILLSLPLLAVATISQIGNQTVSDALVTSGTVNGSIQIKDSKSGNVLSETNENYLWPVQGVVTLEFGESHLPYQVLHTGIDIANSNGKVGDPVRAFMSGRVIYASEINWGYGKHVILDHGNNMTSIYAHLNSVEVIEFQEISKGQTLGTEGSTGWSTGPHLHFEVRVYGIPVNPRNFLK